MANPDQRCAAEERHRCLACDIISITSRQRKKSICNRQNAVCHFRLISCAWAPDPFKSIWTGSDHIRLSHNGFSNVILAAVLLCAIFPEPGPPQERMTIFLASDVTEREAAPMEDERIRASWCTARQLQEMISGGWILDAKTIVGFLRCRQNGEMVCILPYNFP